MNVYKRLRWQEYGGTYVHGWLEFLSRPWQVGGQWGQQPEHASYTSGLALYPVSCPGGFPSWGFSAWRWHCLCVHSCRWWSALCGAYILLQVWVPDWCTLGQSGQAPGRLARSLSLWGHWWRLRRRKAILPLALLTVSLMYGDQDRVSDNVIPRYLIWHYGLLTGFHRQWSISAGAASMTYWCAWSHTLCIKFHFSFLGPLFQVVEVFLKL